MKKAFLLPMALLLAFLPACARRPAQSEAAVRQAIERYLASRPNLNMQGMDMQVGAIRFRDEKAEVDVVFRARNDAQATLSMQYSLKRQGDSWAVAPQAGGHGGMMPSTGPGVGGGLPAGHPPSGSSPPASPELPAGHPPVGSTPPASSDQRAGSAAPAAADPPAKSP